jgi:hypothetical protein
MGDESCPATYVTSGNIPFTMDDPDMENRLRYTPPPGKWGNAFAVFTVIVVDQVRLLINKDVKLFTY